MPVDFSVTNQLASPAIYASSFATRPAASFKGRLFVDTDNPSSGIYRDTGTAWIAIAGTSVGEIQSLNDVCVVGNSTTTLGIEIFGQSSFGENLIAPFGPMPPFGNYALTIGNYSEFQQSLYVQDSSFFNTTVGINTSLTTPLLIGGDTTTSTLTYRTTSAAGITGARHIFQVGNNGATEAMTILNNGNVGIGVTPSAWGSTSFKVLDIGSTTSLYYDGGTILSENLFINSSFQYIYKTTNFASRYAQLSGTHAWYNAPSGTAGNAITFTQAMTLFSTGNLAINSTTDAGFKFDCNGSGRFSGNLTLNTIGTYISTIGRFGTSGGNIFFNNGTGENLILAETASNVYTFGKGTAATAPTSVFSMNLLTLAATFSGALTGTSATFSGTIISSSTAVFQFKNSTSLRWELDRETAETGSNSGSNLQLYRYDDAGAYLGTSLGIIRSTGAVSLGGALSGTSATFSSSVKVGNFTTAQKML